MLIEDTARSGGLHDSLCHAFLAAVITPLVSLVTYDKETKTSNLGNKRSKKPPGGKTVSWFVEIFGEVIFFFTQRRQSRLLAYCTPHIVHKKMFISLRFLSNSESKFAIANYIVVVICPIAIA